ncbi:MAG: tRNA (adenosine(37)-N6)-threonylcarbamoyltransferase complex ATPase subunit type 1 TsaE [Clostridia bacterium]
MKYICNNLKETEQVASNFAKTLKANAVVAYRGSMGMGKTTFTRSLVTALGGGDVVSSPTFAIMNEYQTEKFVVYHFDMYRLFGVDDLYATGFFDFLETGAIILIEWSENIEEALPSDTIFVELSLGENENQRIIEIKGGDFW